MDHNSLFDCARQCLIEADVETTLALSEQMVARFSGQSPVVSGNDELDADLQPVFPEKPRLIDPDQLPHRGAGTVSGRVALIHAIVHIEYNAVHLAWDAIYRFREMPERFYQDWMKVAGEETRHFRLLQTRLKDLGYDYGDLDAHDGLWRIAHMTRHNPLVRMALVPRVLEARGLDVTPGMIRKLENAGDLQTADSLKIIYNDEIGHVEIGSHWFRYLCEKQGVEPEQTFYRLIDEYYREGLRGPYNEEARLQAGFSESELEWLNHGVQS